MPQNGFHGLVGLGVARGLTKRVPANVAPAFAGSVALGSMLPDIDLYPTAIAFLAGRMDLIYVIHRTATHCLPLILVLGLAGALARSSIARFAMWGLAVGVLTHAALDTLFWFTQVDLFWPLSRVPPGRPMLPIVNFWSDLRMPALFVNLREACEYLAFALLLTALHRISPSQTHLALWRRAAWVYFGCMVVTAFALGSMPKIQNVLVTAPYLLAFLPVTWTAVWRARDDIARWARGARDAAQN